MPWAWLRQPLISLLLGLSFAISLHALLVVFSLIDGFESTYAQVTQYLAFLPGDAKRLPWETATLVGITLAAAVFLWATRLPRRLDSFLFSEFDGAVLGAITRHTGMFAWHLPSEGEPRPTWNALQAWVREGAGDGRWPLTWLWTGPNQKCPFSWTILLGSNGSGKTQLAKELARDLARRQEFGSSSEGSSLWRQAIERLGCWWTRVAWWRTSEHIPWDVGVIGKSADRKAEERLARLEQWLPRAPTLMILDDPPVGSCHAVITCLERRKSQFWYPVRLLIVDQFVPPDLPISKTTDRLGWHHRDSAATPFVPIVLPRVEFNSRRFRAVLAQGCWVTGEDGYPVLETGTRIHSLVRDADFERLVRAVEGSPLLLALATHWLRREGATLDRLLSNDVSLLDDEERELFSSAGAQVAQLVAHRLVCDRLEELYQSLKSMERSAAPAAVRKSVACATIADGIPREEAELHFGLTTEQTELHRLFPEIRDEIATVPPLRPWLLGERLVQKVVRDAFSGERGGVPGQNTGLDRLIDDAWKSNPKGTLQSLARPGRLPAKIAARLLTLPLPKTPGERLNLFLAFARGALFESPDRLGPALALAEKIDFDSVPDALDALDRLALGLGISIPAHCALLCRLAARRLEQSLVTRQAKHEVIQRLEPLLQRLHRLDDPSLALQWIAPALLKVPAEASPDEWVEELEFVSLHVVRWLGPQSLAILADASRALAAERQQGASLWEAYATLWSIGLDIEAAEARALEVDSLVRHAGLDAAQRAISATRAWRLVARERCSSPQHRHLTEEAARRADEVAAPFATDVRVQRERVGAWYGVCYSCSEDPERHDATEALARRVDEVAAPFAEDVVIQGYRASCWRQVAWVWRQDRARRSLAEHAAQTVDDIARPFAHDYYLQCERAAAWRFVAWARSVDSELRKGTVAIAQLIDEIAKPFPHHLLMQKERATAWSYVAFARRDDSDIEGTEIVAHSVDSIAQPFPQYAPIQSERASAWLAVAEARSGAQGACEATEAAAQRVDEIAAPFADHAEIQRLRAAAWKSVTWARSEDPRRRAATEEAARWVDEIAAPFADHAEIQLLRAFAWRFVVWDESERPGRSLETEAAARRLDEIANPFFENPDIQEERALSWARVASARSNSEDPAQRELTEHAARMVDAIAELFPDDVCMQRHRAAAWCNVVWARNQSREQSSFSHVAAHEVEEIAKRFALDPELQCERALAWVYVAEARKELGERDAAISAARRGLAIVMRFITVGEEDRLPQVRQRAERVLLSLSAPLDGAVESA